ncbi:MAG TPA: TatD family hydrolase [Anaeromyxobacteraceae bacterium]|nr:TatD family hydrolase [Anaeromyxobacteraceae bacterium]
MLFDPHLHLRGLGARDLADLAFFGVGGALGPCDDGVVPATAAALRRDLEAQSGERLARLRAAGLAGYAALGLHPRRIPARGLEALLHDLPDWLGRRGVRAIGEIGLDQATPREELLLARQLELARTLRLPVLLTAPARSRVKVTRRLLSLVREAELAPERVLVARADARTVKMIRGCGHLAALSLSAGEGAVEEAVRLVRSLGPEGLALASDAGGGGGDLLALPRAADRLRKAGLSPAVVRRVCGANARDWLGLR